MKTPKNILILALLLSLGIICTLSIIIFNKKEVAFVRVPELIEGFSLKSELSNKLKMSIDARTAITDSIKATLATMESQFAQGQATDEEVREYKRLLELYRQKSNQFEQMTNEQAEEYDRQIFNQINQYVEDYGKEHKYAYILGANGNGSMLYAESENDLTNELINYVNARYSASN